MLPHATGCRSHNTGCDGDCDCRSFAELNAALELLSTDRSSSVDEIHEDSLEPMNYCSQCGWAGRAFHACEGVPGGFGDDQDP